MKLWLITFLVVFVLAAFVSVAAKAQPGMSSGEPKRLSELESLGDLIGKASGRGIHVVYVHGMRAEGPGESLDLLNRLIETFGKTGEISKTTEWLRLSPWPQAAKVGDVPIWETQQIWDNSQPFVDRRVFTTNNQVTITIDEINWWPLLFSLKCRTLITEEANLAGLDRAHLDLCRRWISEAAYQSALKTKPGLRAATKGNRYLKHEIMDWGLADAVIALGPMSVYLRAALEGAFEFAAKDSSASEFVVISESLGSFAVLDAYERKEPGVQSVLDRTYKLYFLANQFALLELARIQNMPQTVWLEGTEPTQQMLHDSNVQVTTSPMAALANWAQAPKPEGFVPPLSKVKQIISFSDPNDILTFRVPKIGNACIANVYVRIARPVLGLFANPKTAHAGHWERARVWKKIMQPTNAGQHSVDC